MTFGELVKVTGKQTARIIAECPPKTLPQEQQLFDFEQVSSSIDCAHLRLFRIAQVFDPGHLLDDAVHLA